MLGRTPERLRLPSVAEPSDPTDAGLLAGLARLTGPLMPHSGSGTDPCSTWLRSRSRRRPRGSSFDGSRSHAALGLLVLFPQTKARGPSCQAETTRYRPPSSRPIRRPPGTNDPPWPLHFTSPTVAPACLAACNRAVRMRCRPTRVVSPFQNRSVNRLCWASCLGPSNAAPRPVPVHPEGNTVRLDSLRPRPGFACGSRADRSRPRRGRGVQQFVHEASRPERLGRPWRLRGSRGLLVTESPDTGCCNPTRISPTCQRA